MASDEQYQMFHHSGSSAPLKLFPRVLTAVTKESDG